MSIIKRLERALADACDELAAEARETLTAAAYPEPTDPLVPRARPS